MANMVKKEDVFAVLEESGDIVDRRTLEVLIGRVDKLPMLEKNAVGSAYKAHWALCAAANVAERNKEAVLSKALREADAILCKVLSERGADDE